MQDVVDLARADLNDADKIRRSDPVLLKHANVAIRTAYQLRPDLRLGSYATPVADKALSDAFPLPDDYLRAVADFVVARANAGETDDAHASRAQLFTSSFTAMLGAG